TMIMDELMSGVRRRFSCSLPENLLKMKFTAILLLAVFMQVSAHGYSQKVSLNLKNAKLQKVFSEINRQTGFQFFFKAMRFRKLYSFVYEDNPHSLKGTLHLGFKVEGRLRKHAFDPASGDYLDLIHTGLLAEDAFTANTERLMRRLLAP
ncbi:MAG: hypothetical protein RIQ49_2738, partial [Pseudomonadota bacterium]